MAEAPQKDLPLSTRRAWVAYMYLERSRLYEGSGVSMRPVMITGAGYGTAEVVGQRISCIFSKHEIMDMGEVEHMQRSSGILCIYMGQ